jgi:hypothetical protein
MATTIGAALPDLLMSRLNQQRADAPSDVAVPICTSDELGFPHPALLSYAEITADTSSSLRIAVYGTSATAGNLRRDGRVTLSFVDEHGAWYVKARASAVETPHAIKNGVAVFPLSIVAVLADSVDTSREAPARILSGIRFHRLDPNATS